MLDLCVLKLSNWPAIGIVDRDGVKLRHNPFTHALYGQDPYVPHLPVSSVTGQDQDGLEKSYRYQAVPHRGCGPDEEGPRMDCWTD
ncbi:hypothetical protein NEUTE1DRAFT_86014 [Neurospora tetrasperma FGSC 2508]|uniref:Uncharacterized protein n=1 Tax=Neurospora tetrasperma (strain FGSC 2508 / ATCC MYA-4615 / P0657) TaxID=510951 RepID=F8MU97_NEUT8|nr:uncharacterized protein NEUTE1DRAFT_86014 [Neurospora tetrasperma FGSC 2508]EGO55579.1 hypothetical protein NEUTE1DRAFT_86014 [Neurospora tetrasperma FGSC 2508]EGZ69178.1 hypothetical protein NEUTE2DRAFT_94071 [Neurospora tetrasperma FGSC 2509]